jgi:hypothetical protein
MQGIRFRSVREIMYCWIAFVIMQKWTLYSESRFTVINAPDLCIIYPGFKQGPDILMVLFNNFR